MKLSGVLIQFLDQDHLWVAVRQVVATDLLVLSPLGVRQEDTLFIQRFEVNKAYLRGNFLTLNEKEGIACPYVTTGSVLLVRLSSRDKSIPVSWAPMDYCLRIAGWSPVAIERTVQDIRKGALN